MNHLEVLQKILDNIDDSLEYGTAMYIYSAAIYDSWSNGSDFEKNMISRIVTIWIDKLVNYMDKSYNNANRKEGDLDRSFYC